MEADLPITEATFHPKFRHFEVQEPGADMIFIRHCFHIPAFTGIDFGDEVYRKPPWVIYKKNGSWIYMSYSGNKSGIFTGLWRRIEQCLDFLQSRSARIEEQLKNNRQNSAKTRPSYLVSEFNADYSNANIYSKSKRLFRKGNLSSLTLLPTDQILLAQVLAARQGCYIHASGVIIDGRGLLFVGHSDAGKSTILAMLKDKGKILCDDRMIVRKWNDGFRIHGSWSHGDVPDVSPDAAKLKAIFFLKQDRENRIIPISRKQESVKRLLACLIKPLVTADWWDKMITLIDAMASEVPCYTLKFDKSGRVVDLLERF